jgi:hypothetical protein
VARSGTRLEDRASRIDAAQAGRAPSTNRSTHASPVRYLGIEVEDALELAEQTEA